MLVSGGEFVSCEIFNLLRKILPRSGARVQFPVNVPLSLIHALRMFSVGGQKNFVIPSNGIIYFL